nr:hypothetical protein [Myxococcus sp. RHSTA-1-4]
MRVRIRRFQFVMGLGFVALIGGSFIGGSLRMRLSVRLSALPFEVLAVVLDSAIVNFWLLAALPLICHGAARVVELRPWSTALGAAMTGSAFLLAISTVQSGLAGLWPGGLRPVLNVVAFVVGVVLSARAVTLGRAAAARQVDKAREKAQDRKSEYDEFLRAAEAGGARLEQREAAAQSQASGPESSPSAPDTGKNTAA